MYGDDQAQAAQEQAALRHLRCLDVGLQGSLLRSDQASYEPRGAARVEGRARYWNDAGHDPATAVVQPVARRRARTLEPLPEMSLFRLLQDAAAGFADKPATAFFGAHMTYRELLDHVERCSAVLAGLGVGKGDRVALVHAELPAVRDRLLRLPARLGAIVVGNNPLYTKREMEHQLRDCGPTWWSCSTSCTTDFADVFATRRARSTSSSTRLNDYMPFPKKQLAPR